MAALVLDPSLIKRLKRQRALTGADRFDEVWDGVYVMSPIANNEHQFLAFQIAFNISGAYRIPEEAIIFPGCNVSDRETNWKRNYRCPDVAVFLKGNPAQDRDMHWLGGPDFAVEVVSPKDRSRKKLDFYFKVGVRELLIVDRHPWRLELYRNNGKSLALTGECTPGGRKALASVVVPFSFGLERGQPRPKLVIVHRNGRTTSI